MCPGLAHRLRLREVSFELCSLTSDGDVKLYVQTKGRGVVWSCSEYVAYKRGNTIGKETLHNWKYFGIIETLSVSDDSTSKKDMLVNHSPLRHSPNTVTWCRYRNNEQFPSLQMNLQRKLDSTVCRIWSLPRVNGPTACTLNSSGVETVGDGRLDWVSCWVVGWWGTPTPGAYVCVCVPPFTHTHTHTHTHSHAHTQTHTRTHTDTSTHCVCV